MRLFKTKAKKKADKVEAIFQTAVNLIKDLDKREKDRLIKGMELAWQSFDTIRRVQTIDEKENGNPDIDAAEKILAKEVENLASVKAAAKKNTKHYTDEEQQQLRKRAEAIVIRNEKEAK